MPASLVPAGYAGIDDPIDAEFFGHADAILNPLREHLEELPT
jgi:hypothetical protein